MNILKLRYEHRNERIIMKQLIFVLAGSLQTYFDSKKIALIYAGCGFMIATVLQALMVISGPIESI